MYHRIRVYFVLLDRPAIPARRPWSFAATALQLRSSLPAGAITGHGRVILREPPPGARGSPILNDRALLRHRWTWDGAVIRERNVEGDASWFLRDRRHPVCVGFRDGGGEHKSGNQTFRALYVLLYAPQSLGARLQQIVIAFCYRITISYILDIIE